MVARKLFGEILVDLRLVTLTDVRRVLEAQRRRGSPKKFGHIARDMALIREEHVLATLAVQMRLFPGIERWSLRQILQHLHTPMEAAGEAKVG
jgi:hypothetical protein